MNLLVPPSKISRQYHPCRNCGARTPMNVTTGVETEDELIEFIGYHRNRGTCPSCGALVEAPVRVTVKLDWENMPVHECVPLVMLEDPEVLDDLLHHTPDGLLRVYSLAELERSIEAHVRLEMRRHNLVPDEGILFG